MKRKHGFTLIELLISLGILSIIITMLLSFFIAEVKTYEAINWDSNLEFQSQYVLNFMSRKIMESRKVRHALRDRKTITDQTTEQIVTKLSLLYNDQGKCYIFEKINNKIFYGNGAYNDSATAELGKYIYEIKVLPFPEGSSLSNAAALKITVILSRENHVYEASQLIYFRN